MLTIKDLLSIVGRRMGKRTEEDTAEEEDIRSGFGIEYDRKDFLALRP